MKKRSWLITLALVVVAIIVVWFASGRKVEVDQKPMLSVAAVSISNIDEHKINMNTKMVLKNPLPLELKTKKLEYELFINDKSVIKSTYTKPLTIKSNDSSAIEMPMEILAKPLAGVLKELENQKADSADYKLKATVQLDLPVAGKTNFDFDDTRRLPAFRLPKVHPKDLDVKKLRWKESVLSMEVEIENPNLFPFKMEDVAYDVTLGKDIAMNGTIKGFTNVPAKSTVIVPLELEIKNKQMGKLMWKTLFDKDDTPFATDFVCKIVSDSEMINNSKMVMRTTGKLGDLKKAKDMAKEAE
jgi:LEA14-like dessication related protein